MKTLLKTALVAVVGASLAAVSAVPAYAGPRLPPNAPMPTRPTTPAVAAGAPTSSNGVTALVAGNGSYHVFAVSTAGKLQQGIYTRGARGWGWQTVIPTGVITGTPGVTYDAATNRYDVFAVGGNGQLYQTTNNGRGWGAWHSIGGSNLVGGVTAIRDNSGFYHVFVVNAAGRLLAFGHDKEWFIETIGEDGQVRGTPGVYYDGRDGTYFVVDTGLNGALYYKDIAAKVGNWESAGGANLRSGAAVVAMSTSINVFAVNTAGVLYVSPHVRQFTSLGGTVRGTPGAVVTGGTRVDIFAVGANGSMYQKIYANGKNGAWGRIGGANLA